MFDKKKSLWNFDDINKSKEHAIKQNRFYLAFQQRSDEQWQFLNFSEAEANFQDLATRGLSLIPYSIPLDATLDDWKKRKSDALSILNNSQTLVPILCSKHDIETFEEIYNYEFEKSKLIGVQCYTINDATTLLNLMKVKLRNMKLQTGDEAPLLIGLGYDKVQKSFGRVSGSFVYSCFGFDILSERQIFLENMPTSVVQDILSTSIDETLRYDNILGGFNHSAEQEFWDGINITQAFLESVSVAEGLTPYQAIQWANFHGQQKDFAELSSKILETISPELNQSALGFIESEKEKWSVFWKTKIAPITI